MNAVIILITIHLPCERYFCKQFTWIISLNPINPMRYYLTKIYYCTRFRDEEIMLALGHTTSKLSRVSN